MLFAVQLIVTILIPYKIHILNTMLIKSLCQLQKDTRNSISTSISSIDEIYNIDENGTLL